MLGIAIGMGLPLDTAGNAYILPEADADRVVERAKTFKPLNRKKVNRKRLAATT